MALKVSVHGGRFRLLFEYCDCVFNLDVLRLGVNVIERLSLTQNSRSELHLVMQFMVDKIPVR